MGAAPKQDPEPDPFEPTEDEVRAVIEEADGDAVKAVRALLRDLAVMAADADAAASRGFLRGRFSDGRRRPRVVDEL